MTECTCDYDGVRTRWIDPDRDANRFNADVHYRLYDSSRSGPVVVRVQDFDYADYDGRRFLTYEALSTEDEAEEALEQLRDKTARLIALVERWEGAKA